MPERPEKLAVNGDSKISSATGGENQIVDQVRQQEDLTLTDHLNRRLLTSFLTRINSGAAQEAQENSAQPADAVSAQPDQDDFTD
ncbi:putative glutamyl-tRNA reductase 3, chloroplastic [Frankliniella fusca]|uniref:Glutamyl-tRNA reductase 3, chloroplastic n=1 Tax=Frankliniella fusca TaxID=407009 RepID=A0AAE1LDU6_9NEOP|nr:putative glutamyl-tRNA reductase 3, chloroplastic [Frankliniella fusca]